jgi:chromosome partitioning protein
MDIICPKCKFKRTIDDSRIPNKRAIVHCKACDHRFPLQRARSIGIMISKGGVGKTTTSVNLAHGLALRDYKVLLVDTDTQGQCAYLLGVKPRYGLTDLARGDVEPSEAIFKAREGLWLLGGGKSLAELKRIIDRKDFGAEATLNELLTPLEINYDFIIVDSAPGWDPLTVNVLFYVKEVLVPVSLEVMSVQGLSEFLKSFSSIRKYNKEVNLKYILPTFLNRTNKNSTEILEGFEKLYGKYLCTPIRYSPRVAEAPGYGMTIYEYAGGDKVVADFRDLVDEVVKGDDM